MKIMRLSPEDKEKLKGNLGKAKSKFKELDSNLAESFSGLKKDSYITYTD